ncbi:Lanosterol 14-alpha-demethylase [Rhizina undulata]
MGLLSALLTPLGPCFQQLDKLGTTATVAVGFFTFAVLSIVFNVLNQLFFKDPRKPPVVFHYVPFIGSTIIYGMDPYKFFFDCKAKYGDVFTFILLGKKMTVCLGPKGNDFVFNGKLAEVCAEEAYAHLTVPVFGEGVVYDVPNHVLMEQKKFMKFGLTADTFKSYVPLIVNEVEDYIKKSKHFKGAKGQAPLAEIIPELTIFTASRSLQGKEVREALDGSFAQLYHDLDGGFTPMNFLFPWFPFPHNKKRDHAQRTMARVYMDIIEKRRQQKEVPEELDMIWNLTNKTYKDGRKVSDKEIAHMMIALLMAGQHTSMATITWILLHLASKPEIVKELYDEQIRVFGKELAPMNYEKLSECIILNQVNREILRLHPPLHSIMRKVKSTMHVEGTNWIIPDTHYVLAAPGVTALDETYFKNPQEFDPHRWDNANNEDDGEKFDFGFGMVSKGTASPYLPFGAGRHRCIGEQFASVQLCSIIGTFVREFELMLPEGQSKVPDPDYTSMIAAPPHPSMMQWVRRNP